MKENTIKDAISISISFMHYMNYKNIIGIWTSLYLLFFSIHYQCQLAKIWGGGGGVAAPPFKPSCFYGPVKV